MNRLCYTPYWRSCVHRDWRGSFTCCRW